MSTMDFNHQISTVKCQPLISKSSNYIQNEHSAMLSSEGLNELDLLRTPLSEFKIISSKVTYLQYWKYYAFQVVPRKENCVLMAFACASKARTHEIQDFTTIRALVPSAFLKIMQPDSDVLTFGLTKYMHEVVAPFRMSAGWHQNGFDKNLPIDIENLQQVLKHKVILLRSNRV